MHPNEALIIQMRKVQGLKDGEFFPPSPEFLIDGAARNRAHPDTFKIPDEAERSGLTVGEGCKIGLEAPALEGESNGIAEKFWVTITEVLPEGGYKGVLEHPLHFFEATDGTVFTFGQQHVLTTE